MPRPQSAQAYADVTTRTFTTKDGEVKTLKSSYLELQFSGPNIKSNCPNGATVYYKGSFVAEDAGGNYIWDFTFDTGDVANDSTRFNLNAYALDGEKDLYFTLSLKPYEGWAFSYYNRTTEYTYKIHINVDTIEAGTYPLESI